MHKYAWFRIFMQCDGRHFSVQRVQNRHFGHNISYIEHPKTTIHLMGCRTTIHGKRIAKRTVLHCKMHHFGLQNCHF